MDDSYFRPGMRDSRLVDCVVAINPELSDVLADVEDPSVVLAVKGISPESSDVEDTSVVLPDVEDPTRGVTDGGILGRGLPCQGGLVDVERPVIIILVDDRELVVLVVGRPGSFAGEEDNLVELKLVKFQ